MWKINDRSYTSRWPDIQLNCKTYERNENLKSPQKVSQNM